VSADNYMYIFPLNVRTGERFGVVMRSASVDYDEADDPANDNDWKFPHFRTLQEAMEYAQHPYDDEDMFCEYPPSVSPKIKMKVTYEVIK